MRYGASWHTENDIMSFAKGAAVGFSLNLLEKLMTHVKRAAPKKQNVVETVTVMV